jgi:hypothetical protein
MRTTSELLLIADQHRPRTRQKEIGVSDLGSCRRRVGYKLAGAEPVNPSGNIQAVIGSAVHDMVAQIMEKVAEPGDLVEHEVRFAGILGHLDRFEASTGTVVDTKTTGSRWLEHIKLHGPDHAHLWQVSVYAAALVTMGYDAKRIRIEYLARDTGEEYLWPGPDGAPLNPRNVRDAMEWLQQVRDTSLDMLPRDYDPDSVFCLGCPFGGPDGGICWEGHVPERDRRSVLYLDDPDAEKWASELFDLRAQIKALEAKEKRAKGALDAIRPEMGGHVRCGNKTIDFRRNAKDPTKFSIYFVAGGAS